jgi:hypothetical protein
VNSAPGEPHGRQSISRGVYVRLWLMIKVNGLASPIFLNSWSISRNICTKRPAIRPEAGRAGQLTPAHFNVAISASYMGRSGWAYLFPLLS